jgi:arginyl-tRNA synthetase
MEYAIDRFEQEVRSALASTGLVPDEALAVEAPKAGIDADLTFATFRAARERGVPPPQLAAEIAAGLRFPPDGLAGSAVQAGPYVNFSVAPTRFAAAVLDEIARLGDSYGHDDLGSGQTIVIDYSSPNVAKRMHVGHIRSTIIGQALANILRALGYRVIGDNHIGDWGKSFGVLLAAIEREGYPNGDGETLLAALEDLYARESARIASDPGADEAAREWSLRLEQGDKEARDAWQRIVDLTLQINQASYDRLGVHFDHVYGESFYEPMLADVVRDALASGVATQDESGAVVVDVGEGLPTFLLQRSDGGTLYHTRDVATARFRVREFQPAKIVYVIGAPQELYLRQLFALVKQLGEANDVELIHVPFGTVFDSSGQALSTRRGNMVYLETLLDEAHRRARALIDASETDASDAERDEIAEAVGLGAVIYNDLHQGTRRNITLDWDRMLALEGNSAPYIQYMYARCRSILRRAGDAVPDFDPAVLTHPSEQALIKQLAKLPQAVREAGAELAPQTVAGWCYETARALAAFYRDCHVLNAETDSLRDARLAVVAATAQSLRNGLGLLGINAPERL